MKNDDKFCISRYASLKINISFTKTWTLPVILEIVWMESSKCSLCPTSPVGRGHFLLPLMLGLARCLL